MGLFSATNITERVLEYMFEGIRNQVIISPNRLKRNDFYRLFQKNFTPNPLRTRK